MSRAYGRRDLIRYGVSGVGALVAPGMAQAAQYEGNRLDELDDEGNPVGDVETQDTFGILSSPLAQPPNPPDGTIRSRTFEWLDSGSPDTGNSAAIRLSDRGGVDPNFRPRTDGDLTIAFDWRHASGDSIAYAFNDLDSVTSGFRAFTNGIAGNGFIFRNVFGGSDIGYPTNLKDGEWHRFWLVLDADGNEFRAYGDGSLLGATYYNGRGWTARPQFRVMGRRSGSSTLVDYDRYVVVPAAIDPGDPIDVEPLIWYDTEEGSGSTLRNGSITPGEDLIAEKVALIDDVRTTAMELLPESLAHTLDAEGERLLDDLSTSPPDSRDPARLEALDRMVLTEEVTVAGTEEGIEPAAETAGTLGDLGLTIVTARAGRVMLGGVGRLGRWLSNRLGYVHRQARRAFDDLVGWPTLPRTVRRDVNDRFDRATDDVVAVMETHVDALESAGEAAAGGTLSDGLTHLPDGVMETLRSIGDRLESFFAFVLYSRYLVQTEVVDEGGSRVLPPGLDPAIGRRMVELRDFLEGESLTPDGRQGRTARRDESIDAIESRGSEAVSILRTNRVVVDTLQGASLGLVVLALVVKGVAVATAATGIGVGAAALLAAVGAKLVAIGGAFGVFSALLAGAGVRYGMGALNDMAGIHDAGTTAIVMDGE